jgi:hypothetical protein
MITTEAKSIPGIDEPLDSTEVTAQDAPIGIADERADHGSSSVSCQVLSGL